MSSNILQQHLDQVRVSTSHIDQDLRMPLAIMGIERVSANLEHLLSYNKAGRSLDLGEAQHYLGQMYQVLAFIHDILYLDPQVTISKNLELLERMAMEDSNDE